MIRPLLALAAFTLLGGCRPASEPPADAAPTTSFVDAGDISGSVCDAYFARESDGCLSVVNCHGQPVAFTLDGLRYMSGSTPENQRKLDELRAQLASGTCRADGGLR